MEFTIACETVKRLNRIVWNDHRFIRLEHCIGSTVAIAANRKLAVIERIGANPSNLNGVVHFPLNDGILAQCDIEAPFNGSITITQNIELQYAVAKTTLGYQFQGNAMIGSAPGNEAFNLWREWLPPKPITKTNGAMFWTADWVAMLAATSPSGRIVFPEFIDVTKPVIIRDHIDERWIGIMMTNFMKDDGTVEAATPAVVPKWIVGA